MKDRNAVIFWGVVIVIGIGVATFFGIRAIIRSNAVALFKQDLDAYMALNTGNPGGPLPPKPAGQNVTGKVKGKVITVDTGERAIDYVYFDLPDTLRAAKPEEVSTVVLLNWGKIQVNSYGTGNKPAYQQHVTVRVYDKGTKKLVAETFLLGSDPPPSIKSSASSGSGSKPEKEVVDFLARLPHE